MEDTKNSIIIIFVIIINQVIENIIKIYMSKKL